MAYILLVDGTWGSSPKIPVKFEYDHRRDGANMQYKVKVTIGKVSGSSYYGYPIDTKFYLDGNETYHKHIKDASPSQWSSYVAESDWMTLSNKTSGTTRLGIRLYGGSRDKTYEYDVIVDPANFSSTPSLWVISKNETSVTYGWSTSELCDWIRYHVDGSGGWTDVGNPWATSGSFTVPNWGVASYHDIYIEARRQDSQLWSNSARVGETTYDYPKPNSVTNSLIGDKFTVNMYNPLGRTYKLELISREDNSVLNTYNGSANGNVTGFDDAGTIEKFYKTIPAKQSGTYYAKVTYGSSVKSSSNGTYTIRGTELPNFNSDDWDYTVDNDYDRLTGNDNKVVIANYSSVNFNVDNEPTSDYYATFTNDKSGYTYNWGNETITLTKEKNAKISIQNSNILKVTSYDDRGLSKETSISLDDTKFINYTVPTNLIGATQRLNGIDSETRLKFKGKLGYIGKFGNNGITNTIHKIYYKVKRAGYGEYGDAYEINNFIIDTETGEFIIDDQEIHENGRNNGFPVGTKYNVMVIVVDALGLLGDNYIEIDVTDGKIARDVFQDYDGNYHEGINGRASDDYSQNIEGDFNVNGDFYQNGKLFSGGDTIPYNAIFNYDGDEVPDGYEILAKYDYSKEEVKTGKKWIDGRDIYSKVYEIYIAAGSNWTGISLAQIVGISNFDYIHITGDSFKIQDGRYVKHIGSGNVYIDLLNKHIYFPPDTGASFRYIIVFEYTKTTD